MNKTILSSCGIINALFVAFHVWLGTAIPHWPKLDPAYRALLQTFNLCGLLMIAFLAVAFLACQTDLRSRLGRATILLGILLYLIRALSEFVFFPAVHPAIVAVCVAAGLLHLAALWAVRSGRAAA
jgi:hypothetical protein